MCNSAKLEEQNWVITHASAENREKILDIDRDLEYLFEIDNVGHWIVHLEGTPFQYMVFNKTDMGVMTDAVSQICALTQPPKDIKDLQNVILSTMFFARECA